MDINLPVTSGETLVAFAGFCLLGWNLFLQSQKKALDDRFKIGEERMKASEEKIAAIEKAAFTREDHKEFRSEVLQLIDKMSDSLTSAIEKLSDRLEKFMENRP